MQVKEFNYNGSKISYRIKGEGPLILLLHGFGEDSSVWRHQFDLFPHHQLIIPDLPGSGESEMIDDMTMEGMADMISALVKQSVTLIGHSMGGYIALAYAEKYPACLNAFGLFHSTAYADSDEKKEVRHKGIEFIKRHGSEAFLKAATPNLFSETTKEKKPQLVEEELRRLGNFSSTALVNYYEAMIKRPDRTAVLQNSGIPALFVMGRWDNAAPLQDVLKQCHLPQLSYIHILDNSGHMGMIEETNEANEVLAHFIKTVEKQA